MKTTIRLNKNNGDTIDRIVDENVNHKSIILFDDIFYVYRDHIFRQYDTLIMYFECEEPWEL